MPIFTMSKSRAHPAGSPGSKECAKQRSSRTSSERSPSHPRQTAPQGTVKHENGGARRDRTDDLMLAKHALSQLSYGPGKTDDGDRLEMVGLGRLERPTSPLSGVRSNHLSYRPVPGRHHKMPTCGVKLVREERETKTAVSRKCRLRTLPSLAG